MKGVDLVMERGEMAAVMGPSGCGKTTLPNCLSGLDAVDAGVVVIEGVALSAMPDRERTDHRARRMGFVLRETRTHDPVASADGSRTKCGGIRGPVHGSAVGQTEHPG